MISPRDFQSAARACRRSSGGPRHLVLARPPDPHRGKAQHEERARQDSADKHLFDVRERDDAVQDHRKARRKKQADASRSREQAPPEPLVVAAALEDEQQQGAHGNDGDPGRSGERGEEGADENAHEGKAPGKPAEERAEETHEPLAGPAFRDDVACQREKRNRRDDIPRDHREGLVGSGFQGAVHVKEEQECKAAYQHEDGAPQENARNQKDDEGQIERRENRAHRRRERRPCGGEPCPGA